MIRLSKSVELGVKKVSKTKLICLSDAYAMVLPCAASFQEAPSSAPSDPIDREK